MQRLFRRTVGGLLFSLLLLLSACGTTPTPRTQNSTTPLNLHFDAERFEYTTPESMCSAILTAEVKTITRGTSYWSTPDGLRPRIVPAANQSLEQAIIEQGYRIYTAVTFGTMNILKDHRQQPTAEFVLVGGQVQQDQVWITPFPQLKETDHYLIVFGPGSQPADKGKVEEWLTVYSAFPIDAQGIVTLQRAGSPNEPGPGKLQQAITTPLSALQKQLSACK